LPSVIDTVEDGFDMDAPDFHLAVVSALEPLVVYRSVLIVSTSC